MFLAQLVILLAAVLAEPTPVVIVGGSTSRLVRETDASHPYTFVLTLQGATTEPAVVAWTVTSNQSTSKQTGFVTFPPSASTSRKKNVTIALPGDDFLRATPTQLDVVFGAVSGVTVSGGPHVTIVMEEDDDPLFYADDFFSYDERDVAGLVFTMEPSAEAFVNWETMPGSALEGRDYVGDSGVFHFKTNQPWGRADVELLDNAVLDGDRELYVRLENGVTGKITIRDDELFPGARPEISVADATVAEEINGAATAAEFTVSLSSKSTLPVSVTLQTGDTTAIAGIDYQAVRETIVFAPGETKKTLVVPILDDTFGEDDETFFVSIRAMLNGQVRRLGATGRILKNEPDNDRRRATRH
jgi:hypothetical protein